jgi:hypothetical protein
MVPRWLVQVLQPPQKFERPPFWNGWRYGIKKYGVEVTFNGMTSLLNFIKIYQLVQKLLGGTDRQTGDLTSLTFVFKESRLKKIFARRDLIHTSRTATGTIKRRLHVNAWKCVSMVTRSQAVIGYWSRFYISYHKYKDSVSWHHLVL